MLVSERTRKSRAADMGSDDDDAFEPSYHTDWREWKRKMRIK